MRNGGEVLKSTHKKWSKRRIGDTHTHTHTHMCVRVLELE